MTVGDLARAHQGLIIRRNEAVSAHAVRLWRSQVKVADLDGSWGAVQPAMVAAVSATAVADAASSSTFTASVAGEYGDPPAEGVVPEAFSGIDGSGRDLAGLLFGAVTTTKELIGQGLDLPSAFLGGATYLAAMTKTAIADLGRSSDLVAAASHGYTHYVRVVNPGACSRCAILSGISSYKVAFKRHPACKCTAAPVADDGTVPEGVYSSPADYFESLSKDEQDRVFTKAGAEAIRAGADEITVVGARRGASGINYSRRYQAPKGEIRSLTRVQIGVDRKNGNRPIFGYTTSESTTRRGSQGKRNTRLGQYGRQRLMPETIMTLTDDKDMQKLLLRDAGFIHPSAEEARNTALRFRREAEDRAAADAFYNKLGIYTR